MLKEAFDDLLEHLNQTRLDMAKHDRLKELEKAMAATPSDVPDMPDLTAVHGVAKPSVHPESRRIVEAMMQRLPLPPAVVRLMEDYIHDARAGFRALGNMEPRLTTRGYLRHRRFF